MEKKIFLLNGELEAKAATNPHIQFTINDYQKQLKKMVESFPPESLATSNLNSSFTDGDLKYLKDNQFNTPQDVFNEGVKKKIISSKAYENWVTNTQNKIGELKKQNTNKGVTNKSLRKKYYLKLEQILDNISDTKIVAGKGRNRKKFTLGSGIFINPQDLFKKLELISGSILAGNTSKKIRNEAYMIIDKLLEYGYITKSIYNKYIKEYLIR